MSIDRIASYTAASQFPLKVLQSRDCLDGRTNIRPVHLQFNPTNACNLSCTFCSCANREKKECMPLEEAKRMLSTFALLGTKAITITGGGEPLLHPCINEIIAYANEQAIVVGLVTNGTLIDRLDKAKMHFLPIWIRVSCSDGRDVDRLLKQLGPAVTTLQPIDWAFSYVLTREANYGALRNIVRFAHDMKFCHVRVVADLLDVDGVPDMSVVKKELEDTPGEDLVVYQGRKEFVPGQKRCLISLLKPVIGPDGGVWPCCGVQYALPDPGLDLEDAMRMGHWTDFDDIQKEQFAFDGSKCVKCYYDDYNKLLGLMTTPLTHRRFV